MHYKKFNKYFLLFIFSFPCVSFADPTLPSGDRFLFLKEDPVYHTQDEPKSWSQYDPLPIIVSSGAYGDASGPIPADAPIPDAIENNATPIEFLNRVDLPISDKGLEYVLKLAQGSGNVPESGDIIPNMEFTK